MLGNVQFKKLLNSNNETQQQVAEKLGVTQALVSYWAVGKGRPKYEQLIKLSTILKISTDELIQIFKKGGE
jgi:transcriptional regulator with XRE-family HTH domain